MEVSSIKIVKRITELVGRLFRRKEDPENGDCRNSANYDEQVFIPGKKPGWDEVRLYQEGNEFW